MFSSAKAYTISTCELQLHLFQMARDGSLVTVNPDDPGDIRPFKGTPIFDTTTCRNSYRVTTDLGGTMLDVSIHVIPGSGGAPDMANMMPRSA